MAPVPPPPSAADAAQAYLRRRRSLLVRLARVERALRHCDVWGADGLPWEDRGRAAGRPVLTREALDGLHRMLTEELERLDGALSGS
jgi:hypothetical protein